MSGCSQPETRFPSRAGNRVSHILADQRRRHRRARARRPAAGPGAARPADRPCPGPQLVGGGTHQDDAQAAAGQPRAAARRHGSAYTTTGTPSDCVALALLGILPRAARPGRVGHQPGAEPGPRRHLLGHRGRGDGGGHLWAAGRGRVARQLREPGFQPGGPGRGPRRRPGAASEGCRRASFSTSTCRACRPARSRRAWPSPGWAGASTATS